MSEAPVFTELSARRLGPVRRFFVQRPVAMDVVLLVAFAMWALLVGLSADSTYLLHLYLGGERALQMQLAVVVLTVLGATALVWRRRRPVAVALTMAALGVVALAVTGAPSGFDVGAALALYAVASGERPSTAWLTTGAVVGALLTAAVAFPLPTTVGVIMTGTVVSDPSKLPAAAESLRGAGLLDNPVWYQAGVPVLVLALLAVAAGTSARSRRLHVAAFVDAANALARDQEQRARLAQAAERARIAREMHDIVAHSLSVMVALGGGAAAAVDWAPERAKGALDELVATGRSAIADMRRVLGVLHDGDAETDGAPPSGSQASDAQAPLEPQPGGPDLSTLVDRFRSTGLRVRTTGAVEGGLADVDTSLQLAVYRIVQEALTNALRYAPGTSGVEVGVQADDDHVEVVVTDHGAALPVTAGQGSGRGLVGVRERVSVFGGTVDAGPYGDGWRVRARLPRGGGDA